METAQLEARAIARRIREMTGESGKPLMVYDKGLKSMRPAGYGDMVIFFALSHGMGTVNYRGAVRKEFRRLASRTKDIFRRRKWRSSYLYCR